MELKQIIAMSQQDAENIYPEGTWGIISIFSPGDLVCLQEGWGAVLSLEFDDITYYHSGYKSFSYEQADQILDWVDSNVSNGKIDRLAVHCAAGISRSQAVALFSTKTIRIPMKARNNNFEKILMSWATNEISRRSSCPGQQMK